MKKAGNILFWVVISAVILVLLYMLYNKYRPNTQVREITPQTTQTPQPDGGKASETPKGTDAGASGKEAAKPGGTEAAPGASPEPEERILAPDFTLEDIQGKKVKLFDYKGKIVVLNFWTTWCGYCKLEMPDLDRAAAKMQESGDAVLLSIDVQESADLVKKYIQDEKLSLVPLLDTKGEVAGLYGVDGFPMTFFIRKDGTVYGYIPGQTNEETILSTVEKIR